MEELVQRYHKLVFGLCFRMVGNSHDAEDLTQETFARVFRHLESWDPRRAFRPWLLAIVRNCFCQQLRQQQREPQLAPEELWDQWAQHAPAEESWDAERLQQALDRLPVEYRVVLLMHYFEQATYQQIAQRLNIPLGTVMSRLSRAKARLRAMLSKESGAAVHAASVPAD